MEVGYTYPFISWTLHSMDTLGYGIDRSKKRPQYFYVSGSREYCRIN